MNFEVIEFDCLNFSRVQSTYLSRLLTWFQKKIELELWRLVDVVVG